MKPGRLILCLQHVYSEINVKCTHSKSILRSPAVADTLKCGAMLLQTHSRKSLNKATNTSLKNNWEKIHKKRAAHEGKNIHTLL